LPFAYGSPAVFGQARFVRIADHPEELRDNRRGEVELLADPALALAALADALADTPQGAGGPAALDRAWTAALREEHLRRSQRHQQAMASAPAGRDGHVHPNRIFDALRRVLEPTPSRWPTARTC
jgi:acetolactate synthase-1/2/3 large subunit